MEVLVQHVSVIIPNSVIISKFVFKIKPNQIKSAFKKCWVQTIG